MCKKLHLFIFSHVIFFWNILIKLQTENFPPFLMTFLRESTSPYSQGSTVKKCQWFYIMNLSTLFKVIRTAETMFKHEIYGIFRIFSHNCMHIWSQHNILDIQYNLYRKGSGRAYFTRIQDINTKAYSLDIAVHLKIVTSNIKIRAFLPKEFVVVAKLLLHSTAASHHWVIKAKIESAYLYIIRI